MSDMNKIPAFIFARGGSKGVPRKNIRTVAGIPLIAHTIQLAQKTSWFSEVVISTDCPDIANVAMSYGATVPALRPASLATDEVSEVEAWKYALKEYQVLKQNSFSGPFVSLPCTSPLRNADDIDRAMNHFYEGKYSVVLGITPSSHSPFLNMVKINSKGNLEIAVSSNEQQYHRRQDVPILFNVTTSIYVVKPSYLERDAPLIGEQTGFIEIPQERALDIDSEFDLQVADLLLSLSSRKEERANNVKG